VDDLAERFEERRGELRAIAYRMLGSPSEADDAVQETWLRLARVGAAEIENLTAWLRTVVTRICLDLLRAKRTRREELTGEPAAEVADPARWGPEDQALLADSVSRALLVVLDTLEPAERIAFVLHDMFAVPFDQIAPIVDRTPVAAKKLASRARHKVRGRPAVPVAELARHRAAVEAFLAAARSGDLAAIMAVLAPDVVRHADPATLPPGVPAVLRGARAVAEGTVVLAARSRYAELAMIDGTAGLLVAPHGRLLYALTFTVTGDRIAEYRVIADPARLAALDLAVLP